MGLHGGDPVNYVFSEADGSDLVVAGTTLGRIGVLVC